MNLLIKLSPIIFEFKYISHNNGPSESTTSITILLISILGGGAVSLLTTFLNDWFKERRLNNDYYRADLLKLIKLLDEKKKKHASNQFAVITLYPITEKNLIKNEIYEKIQTVLEKQYNTTSESRNEIDPLILIIKRIIFEI